MAYGRRKKGGQRLMEMSRAGAKRKAARKAKTLAQAKANIAKGPVTRGGVKKKVAAKSTAAGRNRTALRTPKGAGSVAKKKKVATPKSDAGKYMGPYSKRTTSAKKKTTAKRKSSGPAPLPKTMVGRQSFGEMLKEKGPGAALDAGLIASLLLTRGRGPAGAKGKGALSRTMTRLKDAFKPKSSTPGRRKPTAAEKAKDKRTEQGYADFRNQAREASRKNARRRGG